MSFSSWIAALFGREDEGEGTGRLGEAPTLRNGASPPVDAVGMPPTLSELVLGGRYQLEFLIGRGSSAVVYRAHDQVLDQKVAVKALLLDGIASGEAPERLSATLRDECRAAMRLSHPHILRVFNYERWGTWEYVVMEYLGGENLGQLVRRRTVHRLSPRELVRYGCETLEALQYAHEAGVIHNDIKPGNLLLTRPGGIKLCDFGLARMAGMHWETALAGTPAYMSPERIRGQEGDARSDLYSLAATLFMLGNGQTLFGTRPEDALDGHLHMPPPTASHLPPAVHDVLLRALSKSPDDRWEDAEAMALALRKADHRPMGTARLRPAAEPLPAAPQARVERARATTGPGRVVARTPAPPEVRLAPLPEGMVRVERGQVPAFALDRHPVTAGQYAEYLKATRAKPPPDWLGGRPPGSPERPVVQITLAEARAYARWRGKRLPSVEEWLAAARGPQGHAFPWGDAWEPSRCVGPDSGQRGPSPVGGRPEGAAPCGAEDLVGNVWEWTESGEGPDRPVAGSAWVLGGSFRHAPARDGAIARTSVNDAKRYEYVGFRCASDLQSA